MKKAPFCELSVGTFFLFRGQRFEKLGTSLAGDSKSSRIIFDRDTEVEIITKEGPSTNSNGMTDSSV
jgi:hypothetical protein